MGKLPASLFYWGDFVRDPDLRRCTHAEVGVWIRVLCLMFEAEFKGCLATNGIAWTDEEIAHAIGGDTSQTVQCVTALVTKGVASRNENGALINRRMYREHQERLAVRERVRKHRAGESEEDSGNGDVTDVKRKCTTRARAETETETETEDKKQEEKEVPTWIPIDSWTGFTESRKALHAPMTSRAQKLIVRKLDKFRHSGQDPGEVLDQSTANGWKGVFPLDKSGGSNGHTANRSQQRSNGNLEALARASREAYADADSVGGDKTGSDQRRDVEGVRCPPGAIRPRRH
jgi:hypothetical protein